MTAKTKAELLVLVAAFLLLFLLIGYFLLEEFRFILGIFLFLVFIAEIALVVYIFVSTTVKLEERLSALLFHLPSRSVEELKSDYRDVYDLYLKSSDMVKGEFYEKVNKVRDQVEMLLKTKKKIELLLEQQGDIKSRAASLVEMEKLLTKLPRADADQYRIRLMQLRDSLERP